MNHENTTPSLHQDVQLVESFIQSEVSRLLLGGILSELNDMLEEESPKSALQMMMSQQKNAQ